MGLKNGRKNPLPVPWFITPGTEKAYKNQLTCTVYFEIQNYLPLDENHVRVIPNLCEGPF